MTHETCSSAHQANTPPLEPPCPMANKGVPSSHQVGRDRKEVKEKVVPGPGVVEYEEDLQRGTGNGWAQGRILQPNGERCRGVADTRRRRTQLRSEELDLGLGGVRTRLVEEVEQGVEEKAREYQDRFSSTFERMVESDLLAGVCYSSLDSLDALSQADETHNCVSFQAPLTPLIQQRAIEGLERPDPQGLSTVTEQEGLCVASEAESQEAGIEAGTDAGMACRTSPRRLWRHSITSSQSENVLNRSRPRAIPNGFHTDTNRPLDCPSASLNSVRVQGLITSS
ncbi:hypothetical protein JZ751_021858 [Albula glossodonta]|uniref:Uncharacterized protein n=1 Tax=Albula glossodonta TaxID=121402 RepID=A0A8T2NIR5_9TELE|nr:hypothetical protein JZ751_021858 [Albula glossodonta]